MKKFLFFSAIFALILFEPHILGGQTYSRRPIVQSSSKGSDLNTQVNKLKQVLYIISNGYLDTLNLEKISESAIEKMVSELDPHSSYIPQKDVQQMTEPLVGSFEGIGIEYALISDTLSIQSVVAGGPSEKMGLRAGDKIIKVDGEEISGKELTTDKVIKYLRGPKGSKVRIGYLRRGIGENEVVITRDRIPINTVDCSYEVKNGILYLRISRFGAETFDEFMNAIASYTNNQFENDKKFKGLILDLRSNGGGYLTTAQRIANQFLSKGNLLLYMEGRAVNRVNDYADGSGLLQNIPLAILIDEASASASEIVSGAVQDWDRGVIIGHRSFGKGLVQQEYSLLDGSRLRVTIARYHTPSGRVIQTPYSVGNSDLYRQNYVDRVISERFDKDSIKVDENLKFKTLKLGRTVYGGGGIIPDIFIPTDTSYYSKSYLQSVNSGKFVEFVQSYSDSHRDTIKKNYSSYDEFLKRFSVTEEFFNLYLKDSENQGIKFTQDEIDKSGKEIKKLLKGLIIRNIYGLDYYIRYSNLTDKHISKAIESLEKYN